MLSSIRPIGKMEVKIISRETIKPSSPTPNHLRTHKLSLLDQIETAESVYIPAILFYSVAAAPAFDSEKLSHTLKDSLSKTLTYFYPFAGRVKDSFSIDCNDEGVIYMEAQVAAATDMSSVIKEAEIDLLLPLLPSDALERLPNPTPSLETLPEPTSQVLVAIQVNFFACGGIAICACVNHVVADGAAAANFIKSWAEIASGSGADCINHLDVIYDCTSIFPPQDLTNFWKQVVNDAMNKEPELLPQGKAVTKRLLFDGSKISALRNEIGNIGSRTSRFEAVSALIWNAMLSTRSKNDNLFSRVTVSMNLRNRTNPPIPHKCLGNVYQVVESVPVLQEKSSTVINLSSLAGKIHETIRKVDDEYVRKLGDEYLNILRSKAKVKTFLFSSWCRFPFYETDFGWGKPIWIANVLVINRSVIFMDTRDGEGMEAWITLPQPEMAKLEQDPGVLAYSFS